MTLNGPLKKKRTGRDHMKEFPEKGVPQTQERKRRAFAMRDFDVF